VIAAGFYLKNDLTGILSPVNGCRKRDRHLPVWPDPVKNDDMQDRIALDINYTITMKKAEPSCMTPAGQ